MGSHIPDIREAGRARPVDARTAAAAHSAVALFLVHLLITHVAAVVTAVRKVITLIFHGS
ncbi:MAG: hypothetical protein Q8R25_04535 [bacterium]|nr:hypothetical protein [bacterium]